VISLYAVTHTSSSLCFDIITHCIVLLIVTGAVIHECCTGHQEGSGPREMLGTTQLLYRNTLQRSKGKTTVFSAYHNNIYLSVRMHFM